MREMKLVEAPKKNSRVLLWEGGICCIIGGVEIKVELSIYTKVGDKGDP